jgi:hypothetical protein
MPHLRIREIMDELNLLGMTPSHHVLITELVATCLLAAGPKPPMSGTERSRLCRDRKKEACNDATLHVAESAVDSNIINNTKKQITTPLATKTVAKSRGSRLPNPWDPPDSLWLWAKTKLSLSDETLKFETGAFRDYFWGVAGARGVKLDWDKTWANWMRESLRRKKPWEKPAGAYQRPAYLEPQKSYREQRDKQ